MLSFIFRIASEFKAQHGYAPNVLYLNLSQLETLIGEFNERCSMDFIVRFLDMEILVYPHSPHPRVAWVDSPRRPAGIRR